MELDDRQTMMVAILVLFIGKRLNATIPFLRRYNIPEPVTGGVLMSVLLSILYFSTGISLEFYLESRDELLIVFFTTIGLSAGLAALLQGGRPLVILLVLAVIYLFLQNLTGIAVALVSDLPLQMGLIGGSVSLSGGHGTAIAWAPIFIDDYNIESAMEVGLACATFGLVLGGVIGGPIAEWLIKHYNLEPSCEEETTVGVGHEEQTQGKIDVDSMMRVIFVICLCIGLGTQLSKVFVLLGLKLPEFVTCLFAGILITNSVPYLFPKISWKTNEMTLRLVSDYSLGLFLAMSLMSLQLWTLIDLAGPILIILVAQLLTILFFTIFIVFRAMGKNYDAAVMSAGYAGLALGATPTAIANMTAVTKKFGASPLAFIVVPLVGAFFVDISNALIIQTLLGFM